MALEQTAPVNQTFGQSNISDGQAAQGSVAPVATEAAVDPKEQAREAAWLSRERTLRAEARKLKDLERQIKEREAKFQTQEEVRGLAEFRKRLKASPLDTLRDEGVTYDELTNAIINSGTQVDPTIRELQEKLKRVEEQQTKTQETFEESQKQQLETAVNQIRSNVKLLVDADDRFEAIKDMQAQEAVVVLIQETFDSDGILMTEEEAATAVEEHLIEQALRMAKLKKVTSKLTPQEAIQGQAVQQSQALNQKPQSQVSQMRTLTNQSSQSTTPRRLTEKERIERAKLAFHGQLPTG